MKLALFFPFFCLALSLCAQDVAVMTYNIRYDNPADGINSWSNRREKVLTLIRKYDPDIIGVQEALQHQLSDITENIPAYASIGVGRDDGKQKGEYSAILFKKDRFEILYHSTFWLSETPDVPGSKSWDAAITRVATWAKMRDRKSGVTFFFLNTHFDHIGRQARKNSAALLKSRLEFHARTMPVIVTGDFNCTREEEPYKEMITNGGVVLYDPAPADPPGTFCNFAVGAMECRAIDYIFHSAHWTALHYEVITDNDGKNYPSDHLPVTTIVKLK